MNAFIIAVLAALSIWDYPSRHKEHSVLRAKFIAAMRSGDTAAMEKTCRRGVTILPDDPTWRYNLACSLAYFPKRSKEALDELEKAIDLGFRDAQAIAADADLKRLSSERRFEELVEYAKDMSRRPIMFGPLATVDATGVFGQTISLGEQNMGWDFDFGCFVAKMKMAVSSAGGNTGDLYMNRDAGHSVIDPKAFPGLTVLKLDSGGRAKRADLDFPNILFPYPVFGNASRAFLGTKMWRSIPRALMTSEAWRMKTMAKFYLSNQIWAFPAHRDTAPVGTNGDVFASISPYWLVTAGRSFSDRPYLRGALAASASFPAETKRHLLKKGLLAPTIITLIRKSLKGVSDEDAYLSPAAHPTALPAGALDIARLAKAASAMKPADVPPLAPVKVATGQLAKLPPVPELTYATPFAVALVLRAEERMRTFLVASGGADEYAFVQTHGQGVDVKIERQGASAAKVTIDSAGVSPTNRVDIAVFARSSGTGWGAPSYVSFSRMDPSAPYSDPVLTPRPPSTDKAKTK